MKQQCPKCSHVYDIDVLLAVMVGMIKYLGLGM
jgi:hypothetical protein